MDECETDSWQAIAQSSGGILLRRYLKDPCTLPGEEAS